jgi:ribonuclease D
LPSFNINAYAAASREFIDSPHPVLNQQLRRLRDSICAKRDLPVYYVVTGRTLDEMACYLPQTLDELEKISGFGKAKIEKYGSQFLDIITKYSLEQGLSSQIHNKSPKRQRKTGNNTLVKKSDTRAASFELFKTGKSVAEIAKQRGFAIQTIEGHLAYYVNQGAIHIEELVGTEKVLVIQEALKDYTGNAIAPIKAKLSSSISFGEIRLVIAWHQFQNNNH